MAKLSVIIVTYHEAEVLKKCLTSLKGLSDDVIVYDHGGDNETKALVKKFGAKLVVKTKPKIQIVEEIRQKTLKLAKNEYVLVIDPDEWVTPALKKKLKEIVQKDKYAGVAIPRKNLVFGKWIKNSRWWPDHQLRLVKKSLTTWPTYIHAVPEIEGPVLTLPAKEELALNHLNYTDLSAYFTRSVRYAAAEADTAINNNEAITLPLTLKRSVSEFISRFFFDQGFKDGMHGFALAFLQFVYYYLVLFFYWEKNNYQPLASQEELLNHPQQLFRHGLKESLHWTNKLDKPKLANKILRKLL